MGSAGKLLVKDERLAERAAHVSQALQTRVFTGQAVFAWATEALVHVAHELLVADHEDDLPGGDARDVLTPVEELMRALDDQVRLGKILYPAVSDWAAWEIAEATTAARLRDWSSFVAVQLRYNLLDRSPERELLPMADGFCLPVFVWGPLAEGRLTGKYLSGQTGRATKVGRAYTSVGSDDIVRDVVAVAHAQVAISWVRQQPGTVIPQIAARTEDQFRDNLAATEVHLSQPPRGGRAPDRHRSPARELRVERAVLAEAQLVAPRIDHVEGSLAPRANDHVAGRLAMHLIRGEHSELSRAGVDGVDVVYGEG